MIESTGRGSSKTRTMIDFIICTSLLFNRYRLYRLQPYTEVVPRWELIGLESCMAQSCLMQGSPDSRLLFKTWSELKGGCNIRHEFLDL